MNLTDVTSAPETGEQQRRMDDLTLYGQSLEWVDDGTPLPASSIVYLRRPRDQRFPLWELIKTQERLAEAQTASGRFELLILFTVPVEDLARGQLVPVMEARLRLDRMKDATSKVMTGLYDAIDLMNQMRNNP